MGRRRPPGTCARRRDRLPVPCDRREGHRRGALAGRPGDAFGADIELDLPDRSWFALPRTATTDITIGNVIVGRSSALSGASETGDVSCSYQLNAARYGTDHIALWLKLAASNEVAKSISSIVGPCFHTDLMRTIELTNHVVSAVSKDVNARNATARAAL